MIRPFLPSSFSIGPLEFHLYGIFIGLGLVIIYLNISDEIKNSLKVRDYLLGVALGILFGRLFYILVHINEFLIKPKLFYALSIEGTMIPGVLIGAVIALWIISKRRNLRFLNVTDQLAMWLPFAQAIGRWGNFFNEELYGKPWDNPLALYIAKENRIPGYEQFESFHPIFFYEMILNLISGAILLTLNKKVKLSDGVISTIYLLNFSVIRLIINRFRIDEPVIWGLRPTDYFSIILLLFALIRLIMIRQNQKLSTS